VLTGFKRHENISHALQINKQGAFKMTKLNTKQAEKISQLINSLTIWALAVERNDNNDDQTIQYMKWHDQHVDALEEFGISVARYNFKETV